MDEPQIPWWVIFLKMVMLVFPALVFLLCPIIAERIPGDPVAVLFLVFIFGLFLSGIVSLLVGFSFTTAVEGSKRIGAGVGISILIFGANGVLAYVGCSLFPF